MNLSELESLTLPPHLNRMAPPDFSALNFTNWRNTSAPFAIEIGCGVGYHPIQWAKQNVNCQILAIERTKIKFEKFCRRLSQHASLEQQIFAAHADANRLLPHLLTLNSVDNYFLLYPNPEPKRRNHRIAFSTLTKIVVATLKPHGRLTIATNIENYANEVRHWLPLKFSLILERETKIIKDDLLSGRHRFRSHFEKKYLDRGDCCYNFEFRKTNPY